MELREAGAAVDLDLLTDWARTEDARLKGDLGVVKRGATGLLGAEGVEDVDFLPGVIGGVACAIGTLGFVLVATLKPNPFLPRTFSTR